MDTEKDKELCSKYPLLYRDRHASMQTTCMCWGFACGNGWYKIIDELSVKLEAEIVKLREDGMPEEQLPAASQVKEKWGTLSFYLTCGTDGMFDLIDETEALSARTCEDCGAVGKTRSGSWVKTLCDSCLENGNSSANLPEITPEIAQHLAK